MSSKQISEVEMKETDEDNDNNHTISKSELIKTDTDLIIESPDKKEMVFKQNKPFMMVPEVGNPCTPGPEPLIIKYEGGICSEGKLSQYVIWYPLPGLQKCEIEGCD